MMMMKKTVAYLEGIDRIGSSGFHLLHYFPRAESVLVEAVLVFDAL